MPEERVGYRFDVTDEASQPLGSIEQAYVGVMDAMDQMHQTLMQAVRGQNEAMEDAAETAEEVQEETGKTAGKFDELTGAVKDNWLGLDRLGVSWASLTKFLAAASVGAAIVGVAFAFKSLADRAIALKNQLAALNEQYLMSAKQAMIVEGTVLRLQGTFGRTRDEVVSMTSRMLDLALVPGKLEALGTTFGKLSKDILTFSSATGIGVEGAADFADHLLQVQRIPAVGIRNIANAVKAVADNSRIGADELVSFIKGLDPILAMLSDQSGTASEEFVKNMTGIAGALTNIGVDPARATAMFGEMLDRTSEEGVEALSKLAIFTGQNEEALRSMIETDPARIFDELSRAAATMDKDQFRLLAKQLQPLGLEFVELNRLRNEGIKISNNEALTFAKRAAAELAKAEQSKKLEEAAQKRQERLTAAMNKLSGRWDAVLTRMGTSILEKVVLPLSDSLIPVVKDFLVLLETGKLEEYFYSLGDGTYYALEAIKNYWNETKKGQDDLGDTLDNIEGIWNNFFSAFEAIMEGDFDRFIVTFLDSLKRATEMFVRGITYPVRKAFETLGVDVESMIKRIPILGKLFEEPDEKTKAIIEGSTENKAARAAERRREENKEAKLERQRERAAKQEAFNDRGFLPPEAAGGETTDLLAIPGKDVKFTMPREMKTTSPKQEKLLKEQNTILKDVFGALKTAATSPSRHRLDYVRGGR